MVNFNRETGVFFFFSPVSLETDIKNDSRGRQFQFFPAESDIFNILSQYHGFMKLTEKSDIYKNLPQNLPFLLSVSSETVRK